MKLTSAQTLATTVIPLVALPTRRRVSPALAKSVLIHHDVSGAKAGHHRTEFLGEPAHASRIAQTHVTDARGKFGRRSASRHHHRGPQDHRTNLALGVYGRATTLKSWRVSPTATMFGKKNVAQRGASRLIPGDPSRYHPLPPTIDDKAKSPNL